MIVKEIENLLTLEGILSLVCMICLFLVIISFLFSKMLRTHSGSLIMMCCISEMLYFYGTCIRVSADLYYHGKLDFNIYKIIIQIYNIFFTLGFGHMQIHHLNNFLITFVSTMIIISALYYICISVDLILIIRNPLYSPSRRIKIYHFCCLFVPLFFILPIHLVEMNNLPKEDNTDKEIFFHSITQHVIRLIVVSVLFLVSIGSLIFSSIKIRTLLLESTQKRNLIWKIIIYQIFSIIFSLSYIIMTIIDIIVKGEVNRIAKLEYIYFLLITLITISNMGVLPVRLFEPGIMRYIIMTCKPKCLITKKDKERKQKLIVELRKSKTYYAFMYSSLNGQLVESILFGIAYMIKSKANSQEFINRYSTKSKTHYSVHFKDTAKEYIKYDNCRASELSQIIINESSFTNDILDQTLSTNMYLTDITEYCTKEMSKLNEYFGITNQKILNSIDPFLNQKNLLSIGEGEGKSGSFFFYTFDKKYLIKTITEKELRIFLNLFHGYAKHQIDPHGSILTLILGVYTLKIKGLVPVHIILMANALEKSQNKELKYVFDLKGSFIHRYVFPSTQATTLKDLNFLELNRKSKLICMSPKTAANLSQIIERDIKFLERAKIMDYSLLLGVVECNYGAKTIRFLKKKRKNKVFNFRMIYSEDYTKIYFLTIIDIFQRYNFIKRMEHSLKSFKPRGKYISAISPKPYADRFYNFIHSNLLK